ncbi:hypothetical protein BSK59_14000 [Paenibacillus odorifer]|uniref:hypothetical protein n=1 Tax=Paenibacillus odorifer TaxID=189426 RepID=UPI00096F17F4|nr:hypothetical protein [Paenibacillus odorifer]OME55581.1 hypothetical protein BSK59_14000 [Paenibacillus odorifer]
MKRFMSFKEMGVGINYMTPERIELFKVLHRFKHPNCESRITVGDFNSLLAALEESKQQLADSMERERGLKHLCNQSLEEKERANRELAEAQQTIARQREVLEFYANQEHWELPSFGRGHSKVTSDKGSKARELLEEGSNKA